MNELVNLITRLNLAHSYIWELKNAALDVSEQIRLDGKLEGIGLALSYAEEVIRHVSVE